MKNYIKVLPLAFPFDQHKRLWQDCLEDSKRLAPVFNRNGFYYNRKLKIAWLEINGEAWEYNKETFLLDLDYSEGNRRLEHHVYDALKTLQKAKLVSRTKNRNLQKMLDIELQMRRLREITIDASIAGMAARKRFQKFKKKFK